MLGWDRRNVGHRLVETHGSPEAKIAFVEKTLDQGYEIACYRQLRASFGLARRIALAFGKKVLPPLCCAAESHNLNLSTRHLVIASGSSAPGAGRVRVA